MNVASPHPQSLAALQQRFGPGYRWRALFTVMIGSMAALFASTIVNVAVPDISREFALGQERVQWLSAGFMAAMTLSMLSTPWLLERYGFARTYSATVTALGLGGLCGGLAGSFDGVLAMRVFEGLAAGLLQPIPAIIVMRAFSDGERGRAMGIFGFGVVLAPAVGPSIGGVLVEFAGWRGVFFVVLPFCIAALALARRYLPRDVPPVTRDVPQPRLDLIGLALLGVAVFALLHAMVQLHAQSRLGALGLIGLAALAAAGFVRHQLRAAHPLMQVALFANRNFSLASAVAFIYGAALFGSTYLLPVFMQLALRLPPSQAGAVLLPAGLVLAITMAAAGRLADRVAPARMIGPGISLLALSFAAMVFLAPGAAVVVLAGWAVVGRIGMGFVLAPLNLSAMAGLPSSQITHGASTINFMRQLGGAVGVSLTGSVLEWRLQASPDEHVGAFHETFAMLAVLALLALPAVLRLRPLPRISTKLPI